MPTREFIVSFDGSSFALPPEVTNRGWFRNVWFHPDQSYIRNEFKCAQSWITALDVDEGDATLAYLEGSHLHHKEFAKRFKKTDKSDWYKLENITELDFYLQKGCIPKRVKYSAGDMVFGDSRTMHCGVEAVKGRSNQHMRAVVYVCYMPRGTSSVSKGRSKKHLLKVGLLHIGLIR